MAEGDEQTDPGDRRRQDERQLDERDSEGVPGKRFVASRYAVGVPKSRIRSLGDQLVFRLTTNASLTTGFESWSSRLPGGVWTKIAAIGSARNASVTTAIAT